MGGGQAAGSRGARKGGEANKALRFLAQQEKDSGITKNQQKLFLWDPSPVEVRGKAPCSILQMEIFLFSPSPCP